MENTTLVAIRTDTGERLAIGDVEIAQLRELSDGRQLTCPHCGGALRLKAGAVRLHHFAHVSLAECSYFDHEPESDSHRLGKFALYRHFRRSAQFAQLEYWLSQTDQRADCFVRSAEGQSFALEFQQANNTIERWNERHHLYRGSGLSDLWFLGSVRYTESASEPLRPISNYDPMPVPRDRFEAAAGAFRVRELEKAIVAAEHRLVYLDPETEMLTILLARSLIANTLRAYRYRLPLATAELRGTSLWTPLDPLLTDYVHYRATRQT
jgi:hypothetical protein